MWGYLLKWYLFGCPGVPLCLSAPSEGFIKPHIADLDAAIEKLWAAAPPDMQAIDDTTDQWACITTYTVESISAELEQMPDMKIKANKLVEIVNRVRSEVPALSGTFGLLLDDLKSLVDA